MGDVKTTKPSDFSEGKSMKNEQEGQGGFGISPQLVGLRGGNRNFQNPDI